MALDLTDYQKKAAKAVKAFWNSRNASHTKQLASGKVDAGTRGAVTSGKNMNGFVSLLIDLIKANGLKDANIIRDVVFRSHCPAISARPKCGTCW